jgi:hypothetical protein
MNLALILIIITICILLYFLFRPRKFTCPKCFHKQKKFTNSTTEINTRLVHGRKTISGSLDKRYNTRYGSDKTTIYSITCEKCFKEYEKRISNNWKEKLANNDPTLKKLEADFKKMNNTYSGDIEKMKVERPDRFKYYQDIGLISKDYE